MWARLENNIVREIVLDDPQGRFHKDLIFVPCTSNTKCGMIYDNGNFSLVIKKKLKEDFTILIQSHMDSFAKSLGYDSIASAVSYADEPSVIKFQTEGQAFRAWRSLVWEKCYQILADWEASNIPEPTTEEIISQLPVLTI